MSSKELNSIDILKFESEKTDELEKSPFFNFLYNENLTGWNDLNFCKTPSYFPRRTYSGIALSGQSQNIRARTPVNFRTNRLERIKVKLESNKPTKVLTPIPIKSNEKKYHKSFSSITPKLKSIMNINNKAKIFKFKQKYNQKTTENSLERAIIIQKLTACEKSRSPNFFRNRPDRYKLSNRIKDLKNLRC